MKRKLFVLFAAFLMTAFLLGRSQVLTAFADCGSTSVDGDGASCGTGGSTPGDTGSDDSGGGDGNGGDNGGSGGNNGDNGNGGNGNGDTGAGPCTPGTVVQGSAYVPVDSDFLSTVVIEYPNGVPEDSVCAIMTGPMDACTGEFLGAVGYEQGDAGVSIYGCPTDNAIPEHPCDEFIVSGGGITCVSDLTDEGSSGSSWEISAHTSWPGNEIHTRPYPVTLVDWDSVLRVAGLGTTSGSGRLAYAAWGGGSASNPAGGDWKDVVLRLDIRPMTDWAEVFLENVGLLRLQIGHLYTFQWNLPSHPAAGGGPLSGQVGQLEELEPDVPLFSNWSRAPYMVYCTLEYYEWDSVCVGGSDESGGTDCRRDANGVFTGHREWGWYRRSQTVPVPPTAARVDAPASLLADLNGDGVPDAYWGRLSFIRRMDDAGSVTNPQWAHSYSWGAWWYWAVREAQGQIGWPGVPVDP